MCAMGQHLVRARKRCTHDVVTWWPGLAGVWEWGGRGLSRGVDSGEPRRCPPRLHGVRESGVASRGVGSQSRGWRERGDGDIARQGRGTRGGAETGWVKSRSFLQRPAPSARAWAWRQRRPRGPDGRGGAGRGGSVALPGAWCVDRLPEAVRGGLRTSSRNGSNVSRASLSAPRGPRDDRLDTRTLI